MSITISTFGRQVCLATAALLLIAPACRSQVQYNVTTFAGNGTGGFTGDNGQATNAELNLPFSTVFDSQGNLFIADQINQRVRVVNSSGVISTTAGNGTAGFAGDGSGATSAQLDAPSGVTMDSSRNLYIADTANNVVRKVTTSGTISTVAGIGNTTAGYAGDGGLATISLLNAPSAVAFDSAGNFFIADTANNVIRKVDTSGIITTFAGTGYAGFAGDGHEAKFAYLSAPTGLAFDSKGNLYIGDTGNNRIRRVAIDGTISTVAGVTNAGFSGDGGPAVNAQLFGPRGIAIDGSDQIYIADSFNGRIRRIRTDGTIETIAGNGSVGYSGDGGPALDAIFYFPSGVSVDNASGKVYVTDNQNNRIRLLTPVAASPVINGIVGVGAAVATTQAAPGSWIEIYGRYLASTTQGWTQSDFNGVNAPTSLAGTSVKVGGKAAFVSYVSAGQVNVQIPSDVALGDQQIIVTSPVGTSSAYTVTVNALRPLLYAPASFNVSGNQYVLAQFADGATYAAPVGSIPGITSRPAHPGETIVLYGFGFGPVVPDTPAGQQAQGATQLANSYLFLIGGGVATVEYAGLAPGQVGLYQFNLVVPNIAATNLAQIIFNVNGVEETQTLYTAVE
jgi:uncharacterized protein (TIGR03437 family)